MLVERRNGNGGEGEPTMPISEVTPIACAHVASATLSRPMPAMPEAIASRPSSRVFAAPPRDFSLRGRERAAAEAAP